jgi:hypothetical protein
VHYAGMYVCMYVCMYRLINGYTKQDFFNVVFSAWTDVTYDLLYINSPKIGVFAQNNASFCKIGC